MKAILISIKPKWLAKILNGEKTIEIRKTMPKCDLPIDVYIYCTKKQRAETRLFNEKVCKSWNFSRVITYPAKNGEIIGCTMFIANNSISISGKVVAKFTLNKVEELYIKWGWGWKTKTIDDIKVLESKTCLTRYDFAEYLKCKKGYAWHIDNLEIFDKPKELSDFYKGGDWGCDKAYYGDEAILTKAPQSWMYVEVE